MSIELTPPQAQAVAELAAREGGVTLHQLAATEPPPHASDVYATPHGTTDGYRIGAEGEVNPIGEMLPAAE